MFRHKCNRKSCRKLLKNWEFQIFFNNSRRPALKTEILKSNLFHHTTIFFAFNSSMYFWCSGYDVGLWIQRTRVQISVRPQLFFSFFFKWILIYFVSEIFDLIITIIYICMYLRLFVMNKKNSRNARNIAATFFK